MIGADSHSGPFPNGSLLRRWALPAAWFWLMVLPCRLPTPTLEPSWEAVLNFAAAKDLQHGVDIVFTYGPLGYLMQNCFYPGTWLRVLLFQAISRFIYVALVWHLARRAMESQPGARLPVLAFLGAALWLPALDGDSFYLLFTTLLGAWLCGERSSGQETATSPILNWVGVFMVGLFTLIKATFLVYGILSLAIVVASSLWRGRPRTALLSAILFVAAFCFGWAILGGQHFANLSLWLRGQGEMAKSYQEAMGLWPEPNQLVSGLLALFVVAGGLILVIKKSRLCAPTVLLLAIGCCLAWKQSFTRGDEYHTRTFFVYILCAGALLPVLFGLAPNRWAGMFVLGLCLGSSVLVRLPIPIYRAFENARFLVRLPQRDRLWAQQARQFDLPQIRAAIGSATVDVAGAEQAIALLNGFNYHPAPVFQPYAAGTPYLARLNAAFYRSARAPEFVITQDYTIDHRLPNLDNSLTGLVLAECYEAALSEKGFRLLRRVKAAGGEMDLVDSGQVSAGSGIKVLGGQWCEISLEESFIGRLARTCWMLPPVYAELGWANGHSESYRIVPSMAQTGFVVADGAVNLAISPSPAQRLCFRPAIRYRLSQRKQSVGS